MRDWVENRAGVRKLFPWTDLWASRELVGFFAMRDLRIRYKQALLGVAWVVIQPIVTVAAFTLAFDRIANVDSRGLPYPVFALAGLLGWTYLSQCIARGSEVLVANQQLVTKVYFQRLVAPVASLFPSLLDLCIGLLLLGALTAVYGVGPSAALALLPVWLVLLPLTALGPVLILAALNVRFRDVKHVVAPALQALLFLSPVAYSAANLAGPVQYLYALNPFVGVLDLGRFVLVGAPWPGVPIFVSFGMALLLLVGGLVYFQRAQVAFADVI